MIEPIDITAFRGKLKNLYEQQEKDAENLKTKLTEDTVRSLIKAIEYLMIEPVTEIGFMVTIEVLSGYAEEWDELQIKESVLKKMLEFGFDGFLSSAKGDDDHLYLEFFFSLGDEDE